MTKLGVGTFVEESYEKNGDKMLDIFSPIQKEDTMHDGKEIYIFPSSTGILLKAINATVYSTK